MWKQSVRFESSLLALLVEGEGEGEGEDKGKSEDRKIFIVQNIWFQFTLYLPKRIGMLCSAKLASTRM